MKGAFIVNKYYFDSGMQFCFESLKSAFKDITLSLKSPNLIYDSIVNKNEFDFDFAIFWDKDTYLASAIEKCGKPIFNSSWSLSVCDDKLKTYLAIDAIDIPKTIAAPLVYDVNDPFDIDFLKLVSDNLGFPLIVKQNVGSQGRQVYIAKNQQQLNEYYQMLKHIPHHYQKFTGEFGSDIRIYVVGEKAVAACTRQGTGFKSNLSQGATVKLFNASDSYINAAQSIARQLKLDYAAIDFLVTDTPVFLEANSNAYFMGIQKMGVNIADFIANHIIKKLNL